MCTTPLRFKARDLLHHALLGFYGARAQRAAGCTCNQKSDVHGRTVMAIKFVLLVNKQGQTRLAKYTDQTMSVEERRALEGEIVRRCLTRAEKQVATFLSLIESGASLCALTEQTWCSAPLWSTATTKSYTGVMHRSSSWLVLTATRFVAPWTLVFSLSGFCTGSGTEKV